VGIPFRISRKWVKEKVLNCTIKHVKHAMRKEFLGTQFILICNDRLLLLAVSTKMK